MGHPQPQTTVYTDNSTTEGFVNNNIHMKRSKWCDMNFYWLRDQEKKQIKVSWKKGKDIWVDHFTKHHAMTHHRKMPPIYIQELKTSSRGSSS